MKKTQTLRRSLLCGLGVLSLAAVGCGGGGGGTLSSPATLTINGGASASLSRTSKSVSKALGQLATANATITIFDLSGNLLDSLTNQTLPADIVLNDATKAAMSTGSAVFKVSDGTNTYKTIVKVLSTQIGSGPVQAVGGGDLTELVGPASTTVTVLVAIEMENTLGIPVNLGETTSPETKAAVKNLIAQDAPAIDPAAMANSLKSSVNTANSMVKAIVDAVRNQTGTIDTKDFLRKPPAASKALVSKGKRFSKASARLSGAAKASIGNASLKAQLDKKLAAIATTTEANAVNATSGANMISNVVSLASKSTGSAQTAIAAQLTSLVDDNVPITGAAAKGATDILPVIIDNAASFEESGASADIAGFVGCVMQDDTNSANSGVSAAFDALLKVVKDPTTFLGETLKVASDTPAGASRVIKQAAVTAQALGGELDFSQAVKNVAKDGGADLIVALSTVIKDLPASTKTSLFNGDTSANVDSFVGGLADVLTGEALANVADSAGDIGLSANVIADQAKIVGPSSAKSGSTFVLYNNSIATGDLTSYVYVWTVNPAVAGTVATDDSVSFTATSTTGYTVTLTQAKGSVVTTATHAVSVSTLLKPLVLVSTQVLNIAQSKSGAIDVVVFDPEGRVLTVEVSEVGTAAGLTLGTLTGAGGRLTVAAKANALAKAYDVQLVVKSGTTTLLTKLVRVNVKALADTKVFLTGVMDKTVGDSITIRAISVQEKAVSTGLLSLYITESGSNTPVATAVLTVGQTAISATVSNLVTGTYSVWVTAMDGTTQLA
ncbi:hypothetical protein MJH12_11270, partial [bacterium]|nr:hypothetical protein [bacterium]